MRQKKSGAEGLTSVSLFLYEAPFFVQKSQDRVMNVVEKLKKIGRYLPNHDE
jgi:hypothetical protein